MDKKVCLLFILLATILISAPPALAREVKEDGTIIYTDTKEANKYIEQDQCNGYVPQSQFLQPSKCFKLKKVTEGSGGTTARERCSLGPQVVDSKCGLSETQPETKTKTETKAENEGDSFRFSIDPKVRAGLLIGAGVVGCGVTTVLTGGLALIPCGMGAAGGLIGATAGIVVIENTSPAPSSTQQQRSSKQTEVKTLSAPNPSVIYEEDKEATFNISIPEEDFSPRVKWEVEVECGAGFRKPERYTNVGATNNTITFTIENGTPTIGPIPVPFSQDCEFAGGERVGISVYRDGVKYGVTGYEVRKGSKPAGQTPTPDKASCQVIVSLTDQDWDFDFKAEKLLPDTEYDYFRIIYGSDDNPDSKISGKRESDSNGNIFLSRGDSARLTLGKYTSIVTSLSLNNEQVCYASYNFTQRDLEPIDTSRDVGTTEPSGRPGAPGRPGARPVVALPSVIEMVIDRLATPDVEEQVKENFEYIAGEEVNMTAFLYGKKDEARIYQLTGDDLAAARCVPTDTDLVYKLDGQVITSATKKACQPFNFKMPTQVGSHTLSVALPNDENYLKANEDKVEFQIVSSEEEITQTQGQPLFQRVGNIMRDFYERAQDVVPTLPDLPETQLPKEAEPQEEQAEPQAEPEKGVEPGEIPQVEQPETVKKKVVRITINEEDVDLEELKQGFDITLPGIEGQAGQFPFRFEIHYSDGAVETVEHVTLIFNYNPPQEEVPQIKEPEQLEEPILQPEPVEEPQPEAVCRPSYNQCGGTAGLEDYEDTHTIKVTPCELKDGSIDYRKEDLGDLGECP